jgi:cytochrome b pre-mRNA-processing protein 3
VGLLDRLMGRKTDDRAEVRPLWHRIVAIARRRHWFADDGVPDTLEGRFDMVTALLVLVLLRMEREPALIAPSVKLTELFVDDMDGQLREIGVGDLVVGKHMGKLMSLLGGRLGAFREALTMADDAALAEAVARNVSLAEGANQLAVAQGLRTLADELAGISADELLAARFGGES